MNTLQAHWERFQSSASRHGVTAGDLKQIKAAFYLGASSLDHLFRGIAQMDCSGEGRKLAAMQILAEIAEYFENEQAELLKEQEGQHNGQT